MEAAYLHVVLNHLPIVGALMGSVGLVVGLALRSRLALAPGLAILLLSGMSAWPVYATGEAAYKPIRQIADEAGVDWLDEHLDRADQTVWAFYVLAGVAVVALTAPARWPKTATPLALLALVVALGCVGVGGYIAQAGGRVRHEEFRPPVAH